MHKHRCKICAWIYDPAKNDNIPFENQPDDYKCPVCGVSKNEFEVIHHIGEEFTGGEAQEKHVPVIEADSGNVRVKIGSVPHPMEEEHFIGTVELYDDYGAKPIKKISLEPGDDPVATFEGVAYSEKLYALAYCNLHGVWESGK